MTLTLLYLCPASATAGGILWRGLFLALAFREQIRIEISMHVVLQGPDAAEGSAGSAMPAPGRQAPTPS